MVEALIMGPATRVMSLRDGSKKMSKSDSSDYSRINLVDDADTIALKIQKARTDPHPMPGTAKDLEGRPEAANLLGIYAALGDMELGAVLAHFAGRPFSAFKRDLTDLTIAKLSPIVAEMRRLMADPAEIDRGLHRGALRARAISEPVMAQVHDIVGFLRGQ
jgi:tryptophanyl-tRNA synthetase